MKQSSGKWIVLVSIMLLINHYAYSQKLVESVAGIVGNEVIYLSDVENGIVQEMANGNKTPIEDLRCKLYEQELVSKLFLDQARIDSVKVSEAAVEARLNMTLNNYIARAGSEKALEDYFKKSMIEIRADLKKAMMNQETISEEQDKLSENIAVTPADVKKYYANISKDSLAKVPAMVQLSVIQVDPPNTEKNKADARQKLLELRSRIIAGESFSTLAVLYSEDPESAKKGGELGYMARGSLEKPFADAAFSLNKNGVSKIVETRYGFHIIQLIDRMGDMANVRHILIRPQVKPDQASLAMHKLDSIANLIRKDSITFSRAAILYSSHKDSRINGGRMVKNDPQSRVTWFTFDEMDKETYVKVRDLKIGEISEPFRTTDENGNTVFRIVKLDNLTPAHVADLKNDYELLYNSTLEQKRSKFYQDWVTKKIGITYVRISDEFKTCPFLNKGWLK
ncbi:MAG: peptidylprolyl isomerase [Bacteroidales bacterium]|jgi:peptidyl-prolyl cis-trans isomerase SurA